MKDDRQKQSRSTFGDGLFAVPVESVRVAAVFSSYALRVLGAAATAGADALASMTGAASGAGVPRPEAAAAPARTEPARIEPTRTKPAPAEQPHAEQPHAEQPTADDLPVTGWNELSVGSIRARLRTLTLDQLVVLRSYEREHAARPGVVTALNNRIAKLGDES